MPTDAQKRARDKWDSNNTKVLGCKVRIDIAEKFQEYCSQLPDPNNPEKKGRTANAVIKDYILQCISKVDKPDRQDTTGAGYGSDAQSDDERT